MAEPFDADAAKAELAALNKEAMGLLRQAQICQTELTALKGTPGKDEARAALAGRVAMLHRQRFTVRQRAHEIGKQMHDAKKAKALTYVAGSSPTAALREVAGRIGTLERLYVNLCRAADGAHGQDGEPLDWQRLLATARKELGDIRDTEGGDAHAVLRW